MAEDKMSVGCPKCGKRFTIRAAFVGRIVTCTKCTNSWKVAAPPPEPAVAGARASSSSSSSATATATARATATGRAPSSASGSLRSLLDAAGAPASESGGSAPAASYSSGASEFAASMSRRSVSDRMPSGKSATVPSGKSATVPSGKSATVPSGKSVSAPSGKSKVTAASGKSAAVALPKGPAAAAQPKSKRGFGKTVFAGVMSAVVVLVGGAVGYVLLNPAANEAPPRADSAAVASTGGNESEPGGGSAAVGGPAGATAAVIPPVVAAPPAVLPFVPVGPITRAEIDAFFAADKVYEIDVEIAPKELDALRREPRKYTKVTIKEGGKVWKDVAVHVKGAAGSTRSIDDKPALTLNMDKFVDGQNFHGLDKWHLNNSVQDPSYCSELICGELFRAAGVPTARFGHALVKINGKPKGMYTIKEGFDKQFIETNFGTKSGNFYDGGFLRELDQPLQKISGKNDVGDWADIKAVMKAASEPDRTKRFAEMEKVLDVDRFDTYLALESVTCDWDGYPNNRNNYRLYHYPKTNKLIFIPSGMDQMFGDPNWPLIVNCNGFVARQYMDTPEARPRYYKRMAEILKTIYKPEEIVKRLDGIEARIKPALAKVDQGAANDINNQINRLRSAVRQREKVLLAQLDRVINPKPRKTVAGGQGLPDDGYLRNWLFLGPIGATPGTPGPQTLAKDLVGGESALKPDAGTKTKTPAGELTWRAIQAGDDGAVDVLAVLGKQTDFSACYLAGYLVLDKDFKNLTLKVGSDDQCKVWINGKEVHKFEGDRGVVPDNDSVGGISLNKGVNVVVFKIVNGGGGWGGILRFVNPDGSAFMDARLSVKPDGGK